MYWNREVWLSRLLWLYLCRGTGFVFSDFLILLENFTMDKDELQLLKTLMRSEIERKVGYPLQSGPDLAHLSEMIQSETHEYVSATTLKRFWDLYEGHHMPRPSIWNALAKFVGDANFAAFCLRMKSSGVDISGEVGGRKIESCNLTVGVEFDISWAPDRTLTVRYLGDDKFEILHSVNSKLIAGRTFIAPYIIEGMSMLLEDYRPAPDAAPIIYEIGRSGGVTLSL